MSKPLADINFKLEFARKLVGGVIIEVENEIHAKIAQRSGARGVTISSAVGNVKALRMMPEKEFVDSVYDAVAIPIFGQIQVGHSAEADMMIGMGVDFVDESERILDSYSCAKYMDKMGYEVPFCCGAGTLGEIVKAIGKGAALIRLYNDDNANIVHLGSTLESIREDLKKVKELAEEDPSAEKLDEMAKEENCDKDMMIKLAQLDKIPVPIFASHFFATPANVSELMKRGFDGVFISSDVFSIVDDPITLIKGMCMVAANPKNTQTLIAASSGYRFLEPGDTLTNIISNKKKK